MGLVPARRPGWLLEPRCKSGPRGMAAQSASQERRWTEPGLQALWRICSGSQRRSNFSKRKCEWRSRRDRTTGDSRAGAPMATRAASRRRCACATAKAATRSATGPHPRRRTARERWYFCEAHAAEYNKNWNYFAGLESRGGRAARGRGRARREGLPPVRAVEMGAVRATAAEAATRCARSMRSSSTATPTSRP